jgi:large subunit ribosomal protein L17
VHARREISRYVKDREVVKELFNEIAPKVVGRAGGYTRIVKLGQRLGDGAQMGLLEMVDYSTGKEVPKVPVKAKKVKKGWSKKTEPSKTKAEAKQS